MHDAKTAYYNRANGLGLKSSIFTEKLTRHTAIRSVRATTKEILHHPVSAARSREEDAQVRVDFRLRLFGRPGVLLVKYGFKTKSKSFGQIVGMGAVCLRVWQG